MGGGGQGAHVFQEEQKGNSRRQKDVWGGGATVSNWLQINWGNQVNLIAIQPKLSDPLLLHPETIKYDRPLANLAYKTVSDMNMWLPYEDRVWKNLFLSNSLIIGIMHMVDHQGLTEAWAFRFFPLNPTPLYCGPSIQLSKTSFVWHK